MNNRQKPNRIKQETVRLLELSSFDSIPLSSRQMTRSEAEVYVARNPFCFALDALEEGVVLEMQ